MSIADNIETIKANIERAAERSCRSASDVIMVAVSKTVPIERIRGAIQAGVTHLGENRVQEAEQKFVLPGETNEERIARTDITLHMIGSLQRNKARRAAALFDWVQSVDRIELALDLEKTLAEASRKNERLMPVLLEVNLTGETSKSGISRQELPSLAETLAACTHLQGMGLMTIARKDATDKELRHTFSTLRGLLEELRSNYPGHWQHLSMGMSNDYELAIEEGATIVRVGRAIFGER